MKDTNVYVLDDDASVRIGFTRLLTVAGYNVHTYASANEFLAEVGSIVSGCVVLDSRMPGLTGGELIESLSARSPNLAVIFVTADDDSNTKKIAKKMNAAGFFQKPVDGKALVHLVRTDLLPKRQRPTNQL